MKEGDSMEPKTVTVQFSGSSYMNRTREIQAPPVIDLSSRWRNFLVTLGLAEPRYVTPPTTHEQLAPNVIEPGKTLTFVGRTQVQMGLSRLECVPPLAPGKLSLVSVTRHTLHEWSGRHTSADLSPLNLPPLQISDGVFVELLNEGTEPVTAHPVMSGDDKYLLPLAPTFPKKAPAPCGIAPQASANFFALSPCLFRAQRLVIEAVSGSLDQVFVTDTKVGKNSQLVASGGIHASLFASGNKLTAFCDVAQPTMGLGVSLVSLEDRGSRPVMLAIRVEGEQVQIPAVNPDDADSPRLHDSDA